MEYIEQVNEEMSIINGLTDEIYEALADKERADLIKAISQLQKFLEKLKIHGCLRK